MRFKSEKCSFKKLSSRFTMTLAGAWALAWVCTGSAQAVVVSVYSHGGQIGTDAYYAAANGSTVAFQMDPDSDSNKGYAYTAVDVSKEAAAAGTSLSDGISFNVTADQTVALTGSQILVLVVTTGSTSTKFAPIAAVDDVACSSSNCRTMGPPSQGTAGASSFYGVQMVKGQTVKVTLFPKDICTVTGATGCDSGTATVTFGATAESSLLQLNFQLRAWDPSAVPYPGATDTPADSKKMVLHFENASRTSSCPTTAISYYPGDGQIFADLSQFNITTQNPSGYAPMSSTVVVVKQGTSIPLTSNSTAIFSSIDFSSRVGFSANEVISGFTNVTSASDLVNTYTLGFLVRDAAGALWYTAGTGACTTLTLTGVKTSDVQGFLAKGNCFIATATFRSFDSPPVALLREFRDRILAQSQWGRSFIRWYYSWSPYAAERLMDIPSLRYFVFQLLLPIEILAWAILHPFLILASFCFAGGVVLFRRRRISSALVLALALTASSLAQAAGSSPYIDRLLEEGKVAPSQRSKPYIQQLKEEAKEDGTQKKSPDGYTQDLKNSLETLDAANGAEKKSAISAVREGTSGLEMKRPGAIHHSAGFRYSAVFNHDIQGASGTALRSFDSIYGQNYSGDFTLYYEYQPWHSEWLGNLALYSQLGVSFFSGNGSFAVNLGGNFGTSSRTKFNFVLIPVVAGLSYRFNLFRLVRPYVAAGLAGMGYVETRDDGYDAKKGYLKGYSSTVGFSVLLDWMSRDSSWDLYVERGIKHTYFNLEASRLNSLGGDLTVSNSGIYGGFGFEF